MEVKKRALELLKDGGDIFVWQRDAPLEAPARRKVLADLRKRLETEPGPRKPVKIESPKPQKKRTDAPFGTVFLLPLSKRSFAALVLVGHCDTGYKTLEPVFRGFDWSGNQPPTAAELEGRRFIAVEGGLGPEEEFGFFHDKPRENPIADFVRTDIVMPGIAPYSGGGTFRTKSGMIADIKAAIPGRRGSAFPADSLYLVCPGDQLALSRAYGWQFG